MTDIREAREAIAKHMCDAAHANDDRLHDWADSGEHSRDRYRYSADRLIAALSEAGITLCREQQVWRAVDNEHGVMGTQFVPVSEE